MNKFFSAILGFSLEMNERAAISICKKILRPFPFKVVPENYQEQLEAEIINLQARLDFLCSKSKELNERAKQIIADQKEREIQRLHKTTTIQDPLTQVSF